MTGESRPVQPMKRDDVERRATDALRRHGLFSIPVDPVTLANREGIKVHNALFDDAGISGMVAKRGREITLPVNQDDETCRVATRPVGGPTAIPV